MAVADQGGGDARSYCLNGGKIALRCALWAVFLPGFDALVIFWRCRNKKSSLAGASLMYSGGEGGIRTHGTI